MSDRRLVVNPIRCDAYGYCHELVPELVTLDQWGYPMISANPVPDELLDGAERAVRSCPRLALKLDVTRGRS